METRSLLYVRSGCPLVKTSFWPIAISHQMMYQEVNNENEMMRGCQVYSEERLMIGHHNHRIDTWYLILFAIP